MVFLNLGRGGACSSRFRSQIFVCGSASAKAPSGRGLPTKSGGGERGNEGKPQRNGEAKNENPREIRGGLPSVVRRSQTTKNRDEQIHRGFLCDR